MVLKNANSINLHRLHLFSLVLSPALVSGGVILSVVLFFADYFLLEPSMMCCAAMFMGPIGLGIDTGFGLGPGKVLADIVSRVAMVVGKTGPYGVIHTLGEMAKAGNPLVTMPLRIIAKRPGLEYVPGTKPENPTGSLDKFLEVMETREKAIEYGNSVSWDRVTIENERNASYQSVCNNLDNMQSRVESVCHPDVTGTVTAIAADYITGAGDFGNAAKTGLVMDGAKHIFNESIGALNDTAALNASVNHGQIVDTAYHMSLNH